MFDFLKKERFTPVYLDSEEYYKQNQNDQNSINTFSPSEKATNQMLNGYSNPYTKEDTGGYYGVADNQYLPGSEKKWISDNSLYNKKTINGIPLKDYYDTYTKDTLKKGHWFLNKDMPQDTKQYLDDSQVQQRMEIYTGLRQKRDREDLGKPNRTETLNLFTPQERTTGYGYQYGQSGGSGPGLSITRQKEIEDYRRTFKFKTNEQPIEKIMVGPGLSIGTEVPAAGGFHQYTRVVPDNVTNYSANQLPGMVAGGKWMNDAPTSQQPVIRNRPNGYYTLCQYGPGPLRSTMTAESTRPDYSVILKNQNRTVINYGFGTPLTNLNDYLVTN
jgi:hypothetical protein